VAILWLFFKVFFFKIFVRLFGYFVAIFGHVMLRHLFINFTKLANALATIFIWPPPLTKKINEE
jgi:hypothetical protein